MTVLKKVTQVMKYNRFTGSYGLFLCNTALIVLLTTSISIQAAGSEGKTSNTLIWDTISPFGDTADFKNRTNWKTVSTDLLTLERDPVAASSDPGYYGREYAFSGDAVVESENLFTVFNSNNGSAVIYSKRSFHMSLSSRPLRS